MNVTEGDDASFAPDFEDPSDAWSEHRLISALDGVKKVTCMCSIVGSLLILFMILKRRKSTTIRTYNRLLFSISVAEIFSSCALFIGAAAVPDYFPVDGAKGSTTTCNIQAFVFQWFYCSTLFYNTALMVFFNLTVVYEMKEDIFASRIEPFLHIVSILVPLATAVISLVLDSLNPFVGGVNGCWLASIPPGCQFSDFITCTRGEHASILVMSFILVPAYFLTAVLYLSIFLIYRAVKQRERLSQQASFRGGGRALALTSTSSVIMLRSAATKAIMFATVFLVTYVLATIGGTIAWSGKMYGKEKEYLPLITLATVLASCQGFFNFVMYIYPRFKRIRRMMKDKSFLWVLWKAITLETTYPVTSLTNTSGLPESVQTVRAEHILSCHVSCQNEGREQGDDEENRMSKSENENTSMAVNCQISTICEHDGAATGR